jgi:hypothetical protein
METVITASDLSFPLQEEGNYEDGCWEWLILLLEIHKLMSEEACEKYRNVLRRENGTPPKHLWDNWKKEGEINLSTSNFLVFFIKKHTYMGTHIKWILITISIIFLWNGYVTGTISLIMHFSNIHVTTFFIVYLKMPYAVILLVKSLLNSQ